MTKKFKIINIAFISIIIVACGFYNEYVSIGSMDLSEASQKKIVRHGSNEEKIIALTFDDGPHPQYTPDILDLLDKYNIKSTFFVLGQFAEQHPDIIKRQSEEGHEIGNHTYSHINMKKVSKEKFEEEFNKTQEIILSLTGTESKVFRPLYGFCDEKALSIIDKHDCNVILWSTEQDSKDWSNPKVDKIVTYTISNIKNGDIILFHDYVYFEKSNTLEALKLIIPELINKGYRFVTVSELMKLPQ